MRTHGTEPRPLYRKEKRKFTKAPHLTSEMVDAQIQEFLDRGGKIEVLSSNIDDREHALPAAPSPISRNYCPD